MLSARKPHDMITSSIPCSRSHSSMNAMNGLSTSCTIGLGRLEVSGRRRVPLPPTRITACISERPNAFAPVRPAAHREG